MNVIDDTIVLPEFRDPSKVHETNRIVFIDKDLLKDELHFTKKKMDEKERLRIENLEKKAKRKLKKQLERVKRAQNMKAGNLCIQEIVKKETKQNTGTQSYFT